VKKIATDVAAVKKATDDAAAARVVVEDSAMKAAIVEKAVEESTAQEAANMEAMKKAVEESAGSSSSPSPGVGSKRAASLGGSTPLLSGSNEPGNPGIQSICVVTFLFSFICSILDWNFCCSARVPLVRWGLELVEPKMLLRMPAPRTHRLW
jgi:hypothetical protein